MKRLFLPALFLSLLIAYPAVSKNLQDALEAAKDGSASAQYILGQMHRQGQGVSRDRKEALKWYRLAAEQGHADAQYRLGFAYFNGRGTTQDLKKAKKWFQLAAEQGQTNAQVSLGRVYGHGYGMPADQEQSVKWLSIADFLGNKRAKEHLDLVKKKMTPADISKAQKRARSWLEKKGK